MRKQTVSGQQTFETVDDNSCMYDIVQYRLYNELSETEKAKCRPYLDKIRAIREYCESIHFDIGIALLMINMASGKNFRTLQYGRFDGAFDFIKKTWYRSHELLNNPFHEFIMNSGNKGIGFDRYKAWYNSKGIKWNTKYDDLLIDDPNETIHLDYKNIGRDIPND